MFIRLMPLTSSKVIRIVALNGNTALPVELTVPNADSSFLSSFLEKESLFVAYPGQNFRYRFEMCDQKDAAGIWMPVTTPGKSVNMPVQAGEVTVILLIAIPDVVTGPTVPQDDPRTVRIEHQILWREPPIVLKVEAQHACSGLLFKVATNYARASTFILGHESDGPYPVEDIAVSMIYDGNMDIGTHDQPDHVDTGNPDAPGQSDSWSMFPYGSHIHNDAKNSAFVETNDQNRAVLIDVCSGFSAKAVAKTFTGMHYSATAHSH